jgi:hypothetical protein
VKSLYWNLAPTGDRVGPVSVSWRDAGGTVVWTTPIPKGLQFSISDDGRPARDWLDKQRTDDGYAKYWSIEMMRDAIAIEDEGTLLVLDVATGKVRFEWTDPRTRSQRGDSFSEALFDSGDVEITAPGGERCNFHIPQKQNFIHACGKSLVYFDRGILAIFAMGSTWKLVDQKAWHGPSLGELDGECPGSLRKQVDKTTTLAGFKVRAKGERFTICQT